MKYIFIEQLDSTFRLSKVRLDDKSNTIDVSELMERGDFREFQSPKISSDRVVLGLDSSNSSTIERTLEIERANPEKKINKGELDRVVFKALWEFLNEYRSWSFKKLGVTDLDMILAGIDICNVSLDSKNIIDPLELDGEVLSIRLRGSFIPRNTLPIVDHFSSFGDDIRIVERLSVLSSFVGDGDFMVHPGDNKTHTFSINDDEVKFHKAYNFGLDNILSETTKSLGIERDEASEILARHFKGELSKRMKTFMDNNLEPHLEFLDEIISDLQGKSRSDLVFNLPEEIFNASLKDKKNVKRLDFYELLESQGFNIINKEDHSSNLVRTPDYLGFISKPLFASHYQDLNKILERRSKWLVPNN